MGVTGIIGWYRAWLDGGGAPGHHRLGEPQRLRRPVQDVRVGRQGPVPRWVTRPTSPTTRPCIANLELDYSRSSRGSEEALITAFKQATNQRTPLLAYFYDPQWAWSQSPLLEAPLVRGQPARRDEAGCDADPAASRLRLPRVPAVQGRSARRSRENGGPAYELIKNFSLEQPRPEHRVLVHRERGHDGRRGRVPDGSRRTRTRWRPGCQPPESTRSIPIDEPPGAGRPAASFTRCRRAAAW